MQYDSLFYDISSGQMIGFYILREIDFEDTKMLYFLTKVTNYFNSYYSSSVTDRLDLPSVYTPSNDLQSLHVITSYSCKIC